MRGRSRPAGGQSRPPRAASNWVSAKTRIYRLLEPGPHTRNRWAQATDIHTQLDVFLIDEVLTVGDAPFKRKCRTRIREMRETGCTLVIVAHDTPCCGRYATGVLS